MRTKRFGAIACLVTGLYGCSANWQPVTIPPPHQLDERDVIDLHVKMGAKDSVARLHAVRFTHDSISGIYWIEHTSCDTCRTSYALKDVTRAEIGKPGRGAWAVAGPILGVVGAFVVAFTVFLISCPHLDCFE